MNAPHPLRVALSEVVVDRDDVHTLAREGIEVGGQRRDEGLALTGAHLGDVAEMEGGTTHELDVVVALPQGPPSGLADGGESLGEEVVKCLALLQARAVFPRESPQLLIAHRDEVVLDCVDLPGNAVESPKGLALSCAEDLVHDAHPVILDGPVPPIPARRGQGCPRAHPRHRCARGPNAPHARPLRCATAPGVSRRAGARGSSPCCH